MKLADKIIDERKRCGLSQEELAEKLGVSRQAVSKWESEQSTPELKKIIQMADFFGISTDYLLRDEIESTERESKMIESGKDEFVHKVSMKDAVEFISLREKGSKLISVGTAFCILSPVVLIVLGGCVKEGMIGMGLELASAIGMITLFLLIVTAVVFFIYYGNKYAKFEKLEKIKFETEYGVNEVVKTKKDNYEIKYLTGTILGIVLCILASLPLIIAGCLKASKWVCICLTGLLFVLVSIGVALIIRVSMVKLSFDILLHKNRNQVSHQENSL